MANIVARTGSAIPDQSRYFSAAMWAVLGFAALFFSANRGRCLARFSFMSDNNRGRCAVADEIVARSDYLQSLLKTFFVVLPENQLMDNDDRLDKLERDCDELEKRLKDLLPRNEDDENAFFYIAPPFRLGGHDPHRLVPAALKPRPSRDSGAVALPKPQESD